MSVKKFLKDNAGTILTVIGSGFTILACVYSGKNTLKVRELMKEENEQRNEPMTKKEIVKNYWPYYIPTLVFAGASIGCGFASNHMNRKAQAALVSAYTMLRTSYENYKEEVKNLYGEDADQKIKEAYFKDYAEKPEKEPEDDKELFYFMPTTNREMCQYVECTRDDMWNAIYHYNRNFAIGYEVTINHFYDLLGAPHVPNGDSIGWGSEFIEGGCVWIDFTENKTTTDDGLEVTIIEALFEPDELI